MPPPNRLLDAVIVVSAVLSLVPDLGALAIGEYVRTVSSEEASRAEVAAARKAGKIRDFSELVESIHQEVNRFRRTQGLQPLRLNPIISGQARQHSVQMAQKGRAVGHLGFEDRLRKIGEKLPYRAAAENVAVTIGYENPARTAVEGWKTSPGHRKNMLGDFTLTGIGIAESEQGRYFITQIFLEPFQETVQRN